MVRHVRHAAERALPCSFCDSISIYTSPVYIVTYDVIFWSVNLRNNISDKVNVGIFSCDAVFFYSEKRVTRWLLWHSDFTKFNYLWGSLRRSPSSRLGRGTPSLLPTPLDFFGLYPWAKFGWNLCCYGCFVLSLFNNTHNAPQNRYMKTWRHPQNRKYITYLNASRGEPSQGHMQHAQKIGEVRPCGFRVMQTDRQTNGQVNRHAHHNTSQPYGST